MNAQNTEKESSLYYEEKPGSYPLAALAGAAMKIQLQYYTVGRLIMDLDVCMVECRSSLANSVIRLAEG